MEKVINSAVNKYYQLFPILDYLKKFFPDGKLNQSNNYTATCPVCKKYKWAFQIKTFRGICPSCFARGESVVFNTLESLICFTEGCDYPSAIEKIKALSVGTGNSDTLGIELSLIKRNMHDIDEIEDVDFHIKEKIPYKIPIDKQKVKTYLSSRKRSMSMTMLEIFPAYFSSAPFLRDRLIFEIITNSNLGWLGRYIGKNKDVENKMKTLNPRGNILSQMLGINYNLFKDDNKPLLLVEGIFDVMRVVLRGYNAVTAFGCNLSPVQVSLLNDTNASEIVLTLDSDSAGFKGMWKIIKKYSKSINKPLSMIKMPFGCDPDSCEKNAFNLAFENREKLY